MLRVNENGLVLKLSLASFLIGSVISVSTLPSPGYAAEGVMLGGNAAQAEAWKGLAAGMLLGYMQDGASGVATSLSTQVDANATDILGNLLSGGVGTTEVSLGGILSDDAYAGILIVRPLAESQDFTQTLFMQSSLFYLDARTTVNVGLGYRQLVDDDKILLGVNAFYDQEFPYNHQRMSIGGEIRTTVGELNANYYRALSGWVGPAGDETALDGYDLELSLPLPYMPTTMLRAKTFAWYGVDGADDQTGTTISLTGSLTPNLTFELGHTDFSQQAARDFVQLSFSLPLGGRGTTSDDGMVIADKAYAMGSMVDRRLEKVRRQNLIVKQKVRLGVTVTAF